MGEGGGVVGDGGGGVGAADDRVDLNDLSHSHVMQQS